MLFYICGPFHVLNSGSHLSPSPPPLFPFHSITLTNNDRPRRLRHPNPSPYPPNIPIPIRPASIDRVPRQRRVVARVGREGIDRVYFCFCGGGGGRGRGRGVYGDKGEAFVL